MKCIGTVLEKLFYLEVTKKKKKWATKKYLKIPIISKKNAALPDSSFLFLRQVESVGKTICPELFKFAFESKFYKTLPHVEFGPFFFLVENGK